MPSRNRWRRGSRLGAALLLLNVSLTFENLWPTPAVTWRGALSVELAAFVLLALVCHRRAARLGRTGRLALTAVWMVFVIGHYADVTAAALFGRDINLYWDLRFMPDVASLLAAAAPAWTTFLAAGAVVAVLAVVAAAISWAIGVTLEGAARPGPRTALATCGLLVVALFLVQTGGGRVPGLRVAAPVTATYVRQAGLVATALAGTAAIPDGPPMTADLDRVAGADVFIVFIESYGAVSFDRPAFVDRLEAPRAELAAAIRESGRGVVSAFAESPTFGGSSWLAHISLLSGVEVRDADTNALLMTEQRDTLVTAFARRGYRTVALMPGLWQQWPEGAFYGFDAIHAGGGLGYEGPPFGWFAIPDQFAFARLDELEPPATTRPLFVFFPTISTHTPFTPTPPYQPDWQRVLTPHPYDTAVLKAAYNEVPDWLNLSPGYGNALAYAYTTLAGYLRREAGRDMVLVLLGDHQPPALVSGAGAPWDVPVHVIASRPDVLERLQAWGFGAGLEPARPDVATIHGLTPLLLDAFSSH